MPRLPPSVIHAAPAPAVHVSAAELGSVPLIAALAAKSIGSSPSSPASGGNWLDASAAARAAGLSGWPPTRSSSVLRYAPVAGRPRLPPTATPPPPPRHA